jgi:hypothetical protein
MRASPAFQVTVQRFGAWRSGVLALVLAAAAALGAWIAAPDNVHPLRIRLAVAAAGALLLAGGASRLRCRSASLRWDTTKWHLGPASTKGEEPHSGRLAVAIDLGAWMLLRFRHDGAAGRRRSMWLPVQRRGLESQWHALRCAVYSARPAEGHHGSRPAVSPESQE